jgi:DNA modification methylase
MLMAMSDNLLCYGDNFDVLHRHVKDEAVDLVYLDPSFKSNQDYPGAPGLAYLANMAPRLVELRRLLKPTGSIYLHCDPTASHCEVLING